MTHTSADSLDTFSHSGPGRSAQRSVTTQLVACVAIGALLGACMHNEDTSTEVDGDAEVFSVSGVSFTGLDGQSYTAAAGDVSFNAQRVRWQTTVNGQAYVVTGRVDSMDPLIGRVSVATGGAVVFAFDLDNGLYSMSTGDEAATSVHWGDPHENLSDNLSLTAGARALLAQQNPVPTIAAPLALDAFAKALEGAADRASSVTDGIGTVSQQGLAAILWALAAVITAITGLIVAIDRFGEGGDCQPTSDSCQADLNADSVTCNGCLSARCSETFGVGGTTCSCTCF